MALLSTNEVRLANTNDTSYWQQNGHGVVINSRVVGSKYTKIRTYLLDFPEDEGQLHVCSDGQKPQSRDMSRQTTTLVFTSLRSTGN